ncbi:hypothetical protein [Moorena sp. SIO4G3]|nr:hypothetical protein [Moorena sp. SIO4G3]
MVLDLDQGNHSAVSSQQPAVSLMLKINIEQDNLKVRDFTELKV